MNTIGIIGLILSLLYAIWKKFIDDITITTKIIISVIAVISIALLLLPDNFNQSTTINDNSFANQTVSIISTESQVKSMYLSDLTPFSDECKNAGIFDVAYIEPWELSDKDNMGNTYIHGFRIKVYDLANENKTFVVYRNYEINSQYTTITGNFVLHEESKNFSSDKYTAILIILADNREIHRTKILSSGVKPIPFSVNISNATDLTIEVHISGDMQVGIVETQLIP